MTEEMRLIRIGGVCALAVAATQVVGNALHPPMPTGTVDQMEVIRDTAGWLPVHLIITISYFLFIPFVIGTVPAFRNRSALVWIATPLVIVGAGIGVAQILTHLTIFNELADRYFAAGAADRASAVQTFAALWEYSVALEVAHLVAIFLAALLFGVAMMREAVFPRWMAWVGVAAGVVATAGILIGKFVVMTRAGDLIFGISLLPLVVWIVATGITLLRLRPERLLAPTPPAPSPTLAPARPSL